MKTNYKFLSLLFVAGALAWGCQTKTENTDSNEVAEEANEEKFEARKDEKDAEFVADAVASNYAEIGMATLAQEKSNDPKVKEVAQMLVKDHNALLSELKTFAESKSISVPVEAKDDAKRKLEDLREETDMKEFNKEWCKEMADKHEKTIKDFESYADKTEDADLKILIQNTLPNLRQHLDHVKACEQNLASK